MKRFTLSLMVAACAMAIGLNSCKDPVEPVGESVYELGTPTLTASVSTTTSYKTTIALTSNKVTRVIYYMVEENVEGYQAPSAAEIRSSGIKDVIKESLALNIELKSHKSYKVSIMGQGFSQNEAKVFTDVQTLDVTTPADARLSFANTPTKAQFTIKIFRNDVEQIYYKLLPATDAAPTEADLLKETPVTSIYDTDDNLGDYFRVQVKSLAAETRYNLYVIGVNSDGSKSEFYTEKLETKSDTSITLASPTLTSTTATFAITNAGNTDVIKACLYDGSKSTMTADEILASDQAIDLTADYKGASKKEYILTGLTAATSYKFTVAVQRTSATGFVTSTYANKAFTTSAAQ